MKIAIIGGGIAGLATAISLKQKGFNPTVFEQRSSYQIKGMGFLMLPNGIDALEQLGLGELIKKNSLHLSKAIIRQQYTALSQKIGLDETYGITRDTCMQVLCTSLGLEHIVFNSKFDYFEKDTTGTITKVHFKNKTSFEADLFIGADGVNSKTRAYLHHNKPIELPVKEIVGLLYAPDICKELNKTFLKTQDIKNSLSIGMVPCKDNSLVWYIQYNAQKWDVANFSKQELKAFALDRVGHWDYPIADILNRTDFNNVYCWSTKRMDIPTTFSKNNLVLIGDALHPFPTFTSQGTNSALQDAVILSKYIQEFGKNYTRAFNMFEIVRRDILKDYDQAGQQLVNQFINPSANKTEINLPLVK